MTVIRRQALDCVKHIRIHYQLPEPVTASLAAVFPEAEMRLNAFSRFVKGAHDQLALAVAGAWRGTGVVGQPDWIVVFFRADDPEAEPQSLAGVEQRLTAHFGSFLEMPESEAPALELPELNVPGPKTPEIEFPEPVSRQIDVRGLACPWPVRRTRAALETVPLGSVVEVQATDPAAVIDFRHFCATSAHTLLHWQESGGLFRFFIRCGGSRSGEAGGIEPV